MYLKGMFNICNIEFPLCYVHAAIVVLQDPSMSNPRVRGMYTLSVEYRLGPSDLDNPNVITQTERIEVVDTYRLVLLDKDGNPLPGLNITRVNTVDASGNRQVARLCITTSYFGSRTVSTYSLLADPIFMIGNDNLIIRMTSVMNGTIPVGLYRLTLTLDLDNNDRSCPHRMDVGIYVNIIPGEFVYW